MEYTSMRILIRDPNPELIRLLKRARKWVRRAAESKHRHGADPRPLLNEMNRTLKG
jgi:hypothetical protein